MRRLLYGAFGFSGPDRLDELTAQGLPPEEFVYRETRRVIEAAGPDVPICSGIDLEAPTSPPTTPENVDASIREAFRAGARGGVLSRWYDEWSYPTIEAVGAAVRRYAPASGSCGAASAMTSQVYASPVRIRRERGGREAPVPQVERGFEAAHISLPPRRSNRMVQQIEHITHALLFPYSLGSLERVCGGIKPLKPNRGYTE